MKWKCCWWAAAVQSTHSTNANSFHQIKLKINLIPFSSRLLHIIDWTNYCYNILFNFSSRNQKEKIILISFRLVGLLCLLALHQSINWLKCRDSGLGAEELRNSKQTNSNQTPSALSFFFKEAKERPAVWMKWTRKEEWATMMEQKEKWKFSWSGIHWRQRGLRPITQQINKEEPANN